VRVSEAFTGVLLDQILRFPEVHMGVHRITVELGDGTAIGGVLVAWGGQVIRVEGRDPVPFSVRDVVAVHDASGLT
jgi:hypothetical protein